MQILDDGSKSRISMVAAIGATTRALGRGGDLIWHIPEDMRRFKELTMGHPVIMGRKTWESIPAKYRPLPGRTNIVVSRDAGYVAEGAQVATSLEAALALAKTAPGAEEILIAGGGQLYAEALPLTDRLCLTLVESNEPADVYFPPYESEFTKIVSDESHESNGLKYRWVDLERA